MVIRMVIRMVSRMVIRMVSRMVILWLYGFWKDPIIYILQSNVNNVSNMFWTLLGLL